MKKSTLCLAVVVAAAALAVAAQLVALILVYRQAVTIAAVHLV